MTKITESSATVVEKYKKWVNLKKTDGSLEEKFEKLNINNNNNKSVIENVQSSFEKLTLKDSNKLIERGPQRLRDIQVKKYQPYKQQVLLNDSAQLFNELPFNNQNSCNCLKLDECSLCLDICTKEMNSPNFEQFVYESYTNLLQESESLNNIKENKIEHKSASEAKIYIRRKSLDSGFISDASSSCPDSPPQPTTGVVINSYRRVLPKKTIKMSQNDLNAPKITAKEILVSTLNDEFKRKKFVEALKTPDIYSIDENGLCILQRVLREAEPYLEETFYNLVERMKKLPKECEHIVALKNSIINEMKTLQDTSLLQNYFYEAIEFIEQKLKDA